MYLRELPSWPLLSKNNIFVFFLWIPFLFQGKRFREMALASSVYRRQQLQRHPLTILTAAYIHGSQNKDRTASNIKTAQKKDELGPLPEQTRGQQKGATIIELSKV